MAVAQRGERVRAAGTQTVTQAGLHAYVLPGRRHRVLSHPKSFRPGRYAARPVRPATVNVPARLTTAGDQRNGWPQSSGSRKERDVTRFPDRAHFASWNGTAPTGASSGDQVRHRLSRAGNRQINRVLHIMAVVQLRNPTEGRAYYDRKVAAGKTPREAMRCLKRRLSDIACHQVVLDARAAATGPGGHVGTATGSSAAGSNPSAGASEKSLPGPAIHEPMPASLPILQVAPGASGPRRTAAVVKRRLLDDGEDRRTLARQEQPPS